MMLIPNPKCAKCGHLKGGNCLLTNAAIPNPNETFCMHYTESPYVCEVCGKHLTQETVNYTNGNKAPHHLICLQCYTTITTCRGCIESGNCRFEQDQTVPEPPYVMQQVRQGNAIMQTQVKNPKRINLTCRANCPCFINEECMKSADSSCDKYKCAVKDW